MSGRAPLRGPQAFPKSLRLRKRPEFVRVQRRGKRFVSKDLVALHFPNEEDTPRFGLTVSKKVGNAVVRNRTKRRLRDVIRRHHGAVRGLSGNDVVFIARSGASRASYEDLTRQVLDAFRRVARSS